MASSLGCFFLDVFSPSFLHSFALVSLPLRLLLLPLHTRRAVVCSCVVVATGASSSVLNHLFLYLWFCCRPFPRKTTIIIIIELNYFFSLFFVFFLGGCFLGSRKHHNFVANFVKWQRGCWELMELLHTWFRDWWDGDYIFIMALVWSTHQASSCSAWELLVVVIVLSSAHILVIGGTGSISSAAASLVEITPQRIGYLSLVFVFFFFFCTSVCVLYAFHP